MRAAVVITGDELLRGFVQDANTVFLADELRHRSVDLERALVCGDDEERLRSTLQEVLGRGYDLVIVSGGLGPTHDDRTAAVVADVCGRKLELDELALASIEKRVAALAAARGIDPSTFSEGNRKQAHMPAGAVALDPQGTAPGFVIPPGGTTESVIVVLPGPPSELKYGWARAVECEPLTSMLASIPPRHERVIRVWGIPEARMAQQLTTLGHEDSDACRVTLCAREGELEMSIRGDDAAKVDDLTGRLTSELGPLVFATDDERPIAEIVGTVLVSRGQKVSVAESCTGGMLGMLLTERPGSSAWFHGGVEAYSNSVKESTLHVQARALEEHGAVSDIVARQMAVGARDALGATWGVSITGISGPDSDDTEKPVGLVYVGVAGPEVEHVKELRLFGDRSTIRLRSCVAALHELRRQLSTLS